MKRQLFCGLLFALTLTGISASTASAQSTNQQAIQQHLEHQAFLLRGRYLCPKPQPCTLTFNQQGVLQSKAIVGPFSLSAIYVDRVKFHGQNLVLEAHEATLLRLATANPPQIKVLVLNDSKLNIRIPMDAAQPSELPGVMRAIFAFNVQQALNAEPPESRKTDLASLPLLIPETKAQASLEIKKAGWPAKPALDVSPKNGVAAPKFIYGPEPRFSDQAREDKVQGTCELSLIVNTQGIPQDIRVIQSLPDGLDEQAITAVSQYRFQPATKNGNPVPVRMIVEIDFHLGRRP